MKEIFKDIKDYEGLYQVSNLGRVKSLNYKRTGKERILNGVKRWGYLYVTLFKDGVPKRFYIHRLVAEAFISNPENKPYIDHINTNRTDNRVENLRWCTRVENNNNPLTKEKLSETMKGKYLGEKSPCSKPIIGVSKETGEEVRFACTYEAQRVLGVYQSHITACLKGRQKSAGGFYWRYA